MKKSLKTLSFIPSLLKGKCMLLLVMLFTFSFAYGQTDEKTQKASALRKEGMTLHDQGSYLIYGRTLADEGEYYKAIACFGINALLVGEKVGTLEAALKEWENKNITPNSGPLTTLALNKVKEVLKSEPSKYGKLYDIFTTVIPALCRDTLGTPVPFSYAYDLTDDGIKIGRAHV